MLILKLLKILHTLRYSSYAIYRSDFLRLVLKILIFLPLGIWQENSNNFKEQLFKLLFFLAQEVIEEIDKIIIINIIIKL